MGVVEAVGILQIALDDVPVGPSGAIVSKSNSTASSSDRKRNFPTGSGSHWAVAYRELAWRYVMNLFSFEGSKSAKR